MEIKKILDEYGQSHLLSFYDELSSKGQESLLKQIKKIDFKGLDSLIKEAKEGAKEEIDYSNIKPIPYIDKKQLPDKYEKEGFKLLKEGKYALVTMAGGQGTRLGHKGPKGTYDIGIGISLFEIQARRLLSISDRIPWYIMTSEENDEETRNFFEENNYFSYNKELIYFFIQGMMPMVHTDGKILLEEKGKIKEGADGHGGVFKALIESYALDDMKKRGIEWIFTGGIDNVLTGFDDMAFLGYASSRGYEIAGKSLVKRDPYEKVGVFCMNNDRPYVIEYTELTDEMANAKDEFGNYLYSEAHILCNLFNISVFEKMSGKGLPYHIALKTSDYINEEGKKIKMDKPSAYKFESFIFDAFSYFDKMLIMRVERDEEFAPVKNKEGEDSPQSAYRLYKNARGVVL